MAEQVFAYITYKDGVADDSALELVAAAKAVFPEATLTALVAGSGGALGTLCDQLAASYAEVWKIDNPALAYPNAEVVRLALQAILPDNAIVFLPHDTFGMDLGPGLSVKLDAAFVADAVGFET